MATKCDPKICIFFTFGIMFIFAGVVMTIYGNVAEPFFDKSDWCDFCNENYETDKRNIANTKIAGPIMLSLGIVFIVIGCACLKHCSSTNNQSYTQNHVVGYSSTGSGTGTTSQSQQNQPAHPPTQQPTSYPPQNTPYGYQLPPQQYPPMQQASYPPGPTPGQYPPGPAPGQYPPGPTSGQYPPGPTPGQYPPGPAPGQYPPGPAPGQYPPGPPPQGAYAPQQSQMYIQ